MKSKTLRKIFTEAEKSASVKIMLDICVMTVYNYTYSLIRTFSSAGRAPA